MNCARCNKRLSRKTARQIDGVVMCSTCMFKPRPRDSDRSGDPGETAQTGSTVGEKHHD